ncbi:MAG: D-glycerate dehydrogenase [Chloroflexi bacterium]|nr:D-glycerate dehydrogenase [Chloroflexota bacterium]
MKNDKPLVIIAHPLPEEWLEGIRTMCELVIGPEEATSFPKRLYERLDQADGLLTLLIDRIDEAFLARAPHLRVVSNMAVGVDNIDLQACTRRGIPVGNTPGVLTDATADLTMALLLAAARRLPEAAADAREGRWHKWEPAGWLGADLQGATLGIVGMGKIGGAVARRAAGFGVRILYADPGERLDLEAETHAARVNLDELLHNADFVTLHVPLEPATRHLIDRQALRQMKPSAVLVNASRGPVVDMQALHQALTEGWIASAALDVTDPEPLPPDHPLYGLPNCLILPHIGSATQGTRRLMAEMACQNLQAGLGGQRLPYCANPSVYG